MENHEEDQEVKEKRENQKEKAEFKKKEYKKKEERKQKCRKIKEFFKEVPKTEAARIASEIRKEEIEELNRMKEKIWKKWRGKNKTIERRNKIPDEEDKLTKKLQEIERKVEEYKKNKAEKIEKRDKKKKEWKERNKMIVEDTWGMFRWLTQYIDENQHDWIRRKELEEKEMEEEYVRWSGMDKMR